MELLKLTKTIEFFYNKKEIEITKYYLIYRISLYGDIENNERIPFDFLIKYIPKAIEYF